MYVDMVCMCVCIYMYVDMVCMCVCIYMYVDMVCIINFKVGSQVLANHGTDEKLFSMSVSLLLFCK